MIELNVHSLRLHMKDGTIDYVFIGRELRPYSCLTDGYIWMDQFDVARRYIVG